MGWAEPLEKVCFWLWSVPGQVLGAPKNIWRGSSGSLKYSQQGEKRACAGGLMSMVTSGWVSPWVTGDGWS